jgi:ribose transport system permease protein
MEEKTRSSYRIKIILMDYIIFLVFLVIFLFFAILLYDTGFLSLQNLMNVARQSAPIAIMSIGMTFVLCTGEIDLSIGSNVALSAIVTAMLLRDFNIYFAILGGIGIGALIGIINGLLVTKAKIPSFLVTLGMMSILLGIARWVSDIKPISVTNKTFNFIFGLGSIWRIPLLFIWTLLAMVIGQLVLKKTPFGRKVLATGGNILAAKYTGIRVDRIKITVFILSGIIAALGGMIYAGRLQGARYTLGTDDPLIVIAATVIGGTSLFGGKGTVVGAVLGAFLLGIINNGIILLGLSLDQQIIARGAIIILAVAFGARRE